MSNKSLTKRGHNFTTTQYKEKQLIILHMDENVATVSNLLLNFGIWDLGFLPKGERVEV